MFPRLILAVAGFGAVVPASAQTICMTSNCLQDGIPIGCSNRAAPRTTMVTLGGGGLFFTPADPKIEPGECIQWTALSLTHNSSGSSCADDPLCDSSPSAACEWDSGNIDSLAEAPSSTCYYDPASFPAASSDDFYCRIHASPTLGTMRGTMRVTTRINLVLAKVAATNSIRLTWSGGGVTGDRSYKLARQSGGDPRFPAGSTTTVDPDGGVLGASFIDTGDLANLTARYYLVRNKQTNEP